MQVKVMQNIMGHNLAIAGENRNQFKQRNVSTINVMASPGAGKTSVILGIIENLPSSVKAAVIEGDIASSIDAEKIESLGIPVVQINTAGGCHLDANMINEAFADLNIENGLLFIENVGNLVCPSTFDLGENIRLVIASIPEGHDKPAKYLSVFESADVIVLNKTDLSPYVNFDKDFFYNSISTINTRQAPIFEVSCTTKEGLKELTEYIISIRQSAS